MASWLRDFMDPAWEPCIRFGETYHAFYRCTRALSPKVVVDIVVAGIRENVWRWYDELLKGAKTIVQLKQRLERISDITMYARGTSGDKARLARLWHEDVLLTAETVVIMRGSDLPLELLLEIGRWLYGPVRICPV